MPDNSVTLIPHLCCRNAPEAIAFYEKAFGAEAICVLNDPDGKVMHSALNLGGAVVYLVEEYPECGGKSPQALGGTPVSLHLQVADCDAFFQRAVDAGCEVKMPLQEMFWGDRFGMVEDPFGHRWSIATTVRQVSMDDIKAQMCAVEA